MQYRILGKTGLKVSEIGFGGIPIQRATMSEAKKVILKSLDRGINFLDTARAYTDSEEKIGAALAGSGIPRDNVIIASKSMNRDKKGFKEDVDLSLRLLRTDYLDLYQIHNVSNEKQLNAVLQPGGALDGIKEAQREGKVRFIGLTSHLPTLAVKALKTENFDTIQFPFNIVEQEANDLLLPLSRKKEIGTIIMKPLCGGALTLKKTALQYLLGFPVSVVIPGMQSIDEVIENTSISGLPPDKEALDRLREEANKLGSRFCRRCEYCLPCPQGVNISFIFLMFGYWKRYGLKEWARNRYDSLSVKASDCIECGECEEKCPYNLPIREMLKECREALENK
ncbi:MAG: 4Fe-4S binding protein [Firmicutes bacterium]|jgi:predicted aldo/keto reductase-like oxidoreductase|nr:4Fe-4S binding protein [Bacillota bacterium]